ncbi:MAG: hypothetical protein AAF652_21410 [Cyanobacteria bacterium P01_C01_bin.72]
MNLLVQIASSKFYFLYAAKTVVALGFFAAVSIALIAWYNSKRPAGWEGKERPDIVPSVEK